MPDSAVTVSIVVPTVNRADSLLVALQSFVAQNFPADRFEILIVENGSPDATKSVAEAFIARHASHRIRYFYEPVPGLLAGRHRGVLEARAEILVFADDDITADPHWLRTICDVFRDPSVQIVGGRILPQFEASPPEWLRGCWTSEKPYGRSLGYLSLIDLGDHVRMISPLDVWGANLSIRRQALVALGGFHPDTMPDHLMHLKGDGEVGLAMKAQQAGYKTLYHPAAMVSHRIRQERMTPEYFESRLFSQGVADSYTHLRRRGKMRVGSPRQRARYALGMVKSHLASVGTPWSERRKIQLDGHHPRAEWKPLSESAVNHPRLRQAYRRGIEFHQSAVRDIPGLLEWILRDHYWDYRLPKLPTATGSLPWGWSRGLTHIERKSGWFGG